MRYEKHARVALLNVGQTKGYVSDLTQREIDFIYDHRLKMPNKKSRLIPRMPICLISRFMIWIHQRQSP